MILSAKTIREELRRVPLRIEPFHERTVHPETGTSYGITLSGYDVRVREEVELMPGHFMIASILEYIQMPLDLVGFVKDKSSLARLGLAVQNTVIEAGWRGYLTLELSHHGRDRLRLPAGSPVAQIMFLRIDQPTEGYQGKYNDQPPVPVAAIREELGGAAAADVPQKAHAPSLEVLTGGPASSGDAPCPSHAKNVGILIPQGSRPNDQ
jgi:dCTP deaminase